MRKRLGSHVPQSHLELEMTLSKIIKMFNIIWENILVFNCEILGQSFARRFKFTHKVFKLWLSKGLNKIIELDVD